MVTAELTRPATEEPIKSQQRMKSNLKLDATDRKILEILQANSNITNAQLAKEIGLSPAPTLERVNKLETSGVIKSYHAVIDPASAASAMFLNGQEIFAY